MKTDEELAKALLALLCSEPLSARKRGFIKRHSSILGTTPEKLKAAYWWLYGKGYARFRGGGALVEIYATDEGKEYARSYRASYELLIAIKKKISDGKSSTKEESEKESDKIAAETMRQLDKNELRALLGRRSPPPVRPVVRDQY